MLRVLINQHPAGWSTINEKDFHLSPGFAAFHHDANEGETFHRDLYYQQKVSEDRRRPQCYCHGERREKAQILTSWPQATQYGAEYGYVLDEVSSSMTIYARTLETWCCIAVVELDGVEHDWEMLDTYSMQDQGKEEISHVW